MNPSMLPSESFDAEELRLLLWQLRDGVLNAEDASRLDSLVVQHAEARQLYVQMTQLFTNLHWYAAADGVDESLLAAIAAEVYRPHASSFFNSPTRSSRSTLLATLSIAAVFYGVFVFLAWGLRPMGALVREDAIEVVHTHLPPTKYGVAEVLMAHDAKCKRTDLPNSRPMDLEHGDRLEAGSRWLLLSGSVSVRFDAGAKVNFAAPADFTVSDANAARLDLGALAANVPREAVGFTVETPTSKVVDLGTEFGLSTDRNGVTHVQVFVGKVQLTPSLLTQTGGVKGENGPTVVLGAGDARQLTPNPETGSVDVRDVGDKFADSVQPRVKFPRQVRENVKAGLRRVEHGGTFGKNNLARLPEAKAFAIDWMDGRTLSPRYPAHRIENLNDGCYGNQFSWLGKTGSPAFAGVAFGSRQKIASIAFGRDNGGDEITPDKADYDDLWEGVYTLQYTIEDNPSESTANDRWVTLGTVEYRRDDPLVTSGFLKPMLRHRYGFPSVEATGVRIVVPRPNTCIDEIEVYGD